MIKTDLITGFLGSGKTTFIQKYARYLIQKGEHIGILENDFGAVNVDAMLLSELEGNNCSIETVAGAFDADCHKRRFKSKLITMAMMGFNRVIIEPSGIFDIDEFFDILHEDPLDRWYEIDNIIAIADANLKKNLSENSEYLLASQCAHAGSILFSKVQETSEEMILNTIAYLNSILKKFGCKRVLQNELIDKDWSKLNQEDFQKISHSSYHHASYIKIFSNQNYQTLYYMNQKITFNYLKKIVENLFQNPACGHIFRIKGFFKEEEQYYELNAVREKTEIKPIHNGQEIIIIIGENLNKNKINDYLK